jgi:formate dehydrogenase subunit beta
MALDREAWNVWLADKGFGAWAKAIYPDPTVPDLSVSRSCEVCRAPFAEQADVNLMFYGTNQAFLLKPGTPKGRDILDQLGIVPDEFPAGRDQVKETLVRKAQVAFDEMGADVFQVTDDLSKLATFFSACINCYNCRTVCPVCYCRECVFNTDVFSHDPIQYHLWADKKGFIGLPPDTLFYHLTRMAHMGHACVGCGQCTRACPSGIPVSDLFFQVGCHIQKAFDYVPGGDALPPFTTFNPHEFEDALGIE